MTALHIVGIVAVTIVVMCAAGAGLWWVLYWIASMRD